MDEIDLHEAYSGHPTVFSIKLHYSGEFTKFPSRKYVKGKVKYIDLLDSDTFYVHDTDEIMEELHQVEEAPTVKFDLNGPDVDEFDLNGVNVGVDKGGGDSQELSDSDDSDFLIDEDKIIDEPEVDMKEYFLHIDKDLEWIGNHS
ncbi:unnamed protein product [Lactuca saligna]|uniref:PB1-like domain-containing protein n=1 Tax=Lactuca saligna TaxID=75948 RepID=A0AA36EDQ2_LACSI|nr:unnamed protein product [Lactuca saligna]